MSKFLGFLFLVVVALFLFSCSSDDDCTKMVNIPKFDQNLGEFVDDFQEVSCDLGDPVDGRIIN